MAQRKRVAAAEARAEMKDLVDAVKLRNERVKITRYGKTVAYLVPPEDGEALDNCEPEIADCAKRRQAGKQPAKLARIKGGGSSRPE